MEMTINKNLLKGDKILLYKLAVISLVSLIGVMILLYHTRFGPMLTSDSASYIQGAINIREGKGYSRFSGEDTLVPITGFPPILSLALAGLSLSGLEIQEVARFFNALLFGASVFMAGLFIIRYTSSILASLLGCLLIITSKSLIVADSYLLSEALFTFLLLLSIYALIRYFQTNSRYTLAATGILVALTILTRYAGLSLAVAFPISIAFLGKGGWKRRITDILLLGLAVLIPVGLWGYRNFALAGTPANRVVGFYSISYEIIVAYVDEWMALIFPGGFGIRWGLRVILTFMGLACLSVLFILREFKSGSLQGQPLKKEWIILPWVLLILIPIYQVSIIANTIFFDASTGAAAARRFLSPVLIPVIILVMCMLYRLVWEHPGNPLLKSSSLLYGLALLALSAQITVGFIRDPRFGAERADAEQVWAEVVKGLQELEPSRPLISNDPQLLYLISKRSAYRAPIWYSQYTQQFNDEFTQDLTEMRRRMDDGAILVIFRDPLPSEDEQERKTTQLYLKTITQGLVKLAGYSRATFYGSPNVQGAPAP